MEGLNGILRSEERIVLSLRSLYGRYGYSRYKMGKFEEYDFYAHNKDFLGGEAVLTFTDMNGRLMALKPDITLSVIRHIRDVPGVVNKVFYEERVYRVPRRAQAFREIMQLGLECVGAVDDYCVWEVLMLAAESLSSIGRNCVLDVSHLDILSAAVDALELPEEAREEVMRCVEGRSLQGLADICAGAGADPERTEALIRLISAYGRPDEVLPLLRDLPGLPAGEIARLERLVDALRGTAAEDMLRIDFSLVSNLEYYNGIVFRGFVEGAPTRVLSGGQYDRLMRRMGRSSRGIGFAVYLDALERLGGAAPEFDVDDVLLCGEGDALADLCAAVRELTDQGRSVSVQGALPQGVKFRRLLRLSGGRVKAVEEHE